uniref:Uncharacterized protein n=1 Tax=Candidatus Kentrum eta TaxID=2126337 RepID=A0A450VDS5_9GAMM|nr:MAG: hypothetical protein BECKH772B_GA0070898_103163 [Candidatus Kentron sp. H]VFK03947.1 MAG: hypothetical protein BECKH772A_GA0070896_103683 [Candidatus Kentron sp. H]VFK05923.1 MAG: hypothetical protein BECKH772C_GA0070978_103123 [Candidatus Kentron sp. H]
MTGRSSESGLPTASDLRVTLNTALPLGVGYMGAMLICLKDPLFHAPKGLRMRSPGLRQNLLSWRYPGYPVAPDQPQRGCVVVLGITFFYATPLGLDLCAVAVVEYQPGIQQEP